MPQYFFGFYHWRRRSHSAALLLVAILLVSIATLLPFYLKLPVLGIALILAGCGLRGIRKLIKPHPWAVEKKKYNILAESLPLDTAETVVDFGCGTGRSVVGLSPHVNKGTTIIGVDRFDDQIILGNTPSVTSRNAATAGLSVELFRADGRSIPLCEDSIDVVIVSQVLHDLPEADVDCILAELARICAPDGQLGLIELPLVADSETVDVSFWTRKIEDVGFDLISVETIPWKEGQERVILSATPKAEQEHPPRSV